MKTLLSLLCAAVLLGPAHGQPGSTKSSHFPLYPLKKGAKWTYKAGPDTIVVVVKKIEKVGMEEQSELETSKSDGTVLANEHVIVRGDGAFRTAVGNVLVEPAMCFLKFPETPMQGGPGEKPDKPEKPKPVSWTVNSKVGKETLSGKFTLGEQDIEI